MDGEEFSRRLAVMSNLHSSGIVRELQPEHDGFGGSIWSWEILKPELLPKLPWLEANIINNNGIVRI